MKKNTLTALFATMALTATLGLAACGGSQTPAPEAPAAEPQATEQTTEQQAAPATTEQTKTETKTETTAPAPAPAPAQNDYIGDEAAKSAALSHAGFAASDVYELQSELDLDDATIHYDVEFKANGMEYDYDIDAVTGAVIYSSSEVDD